MPRSHVERESLILRILSGRPQVRNEKARRFLMNMRKKPGVPFEQHFPKADKGALNLLRRLLAFDPSERPTAGAPGAGEQQAFCRSRRFRSLPWGCVPGCGGGRDVPPRGTGAPAPDLFSLFLATERANRSRSRLRIVGGARDLIFVPRVPAPTAEEALADPYFAGLSQPSREPSAQPVSKVAFEFERRKLTVEEVRDLIYREILEYHPQMLADYMAGGQRQPNFMYPSAGALGRAPRLRDLRAHGRSRVPFPPLRPPQCVRAPVLVPPSLRGVGGGGEGGSEASPTCPSACPRRASCQPPRLPDPLRAVDNFRRQFAHLESGGKGQDRHLGQATSLPRERIRDFQSEAQRYGARVGAHHMSGVSGAMAYVPAPVPATEATSVPAPAPAYAGGSMDMEDSSRAVEFLGSSVERMSVMDGGNGHAPVQDYAHARRSHEPPPPTRYPYLPPGEDQTGTSRAPR